MGSTYVLSFMDDVLRRTILRGWELEVDDQDIYYKLLHLIFEQEDSWAYSKNYRVTLTIDHRVSYTWRFRVRILTP